MNAQEIARERNRRLTLAAVVLDIDKEAYVPDCDYDDELDPNILPGEQEQLEKYRKIVLIPPQPTAVITKHQSNAKAPGGEMRMRNMADILRMMVLNDEKRDRDRKTISQKDIAELLKSVRTFCGPKRNGPDGVQTTVVVRKLLHDVRRRLLLVRRPKLFEPNRKVV